MTPKSDHTRLLCGHLARPARAALLALSAVALLASASTSAVAQWRYHHARHYGYPYNAGTVTSGGPIFRNGYYLGTDPDPRIRQELIRDPWFSRNRR